MFVTVVGLVKMEYRKVISFGKSSFVISLPKSWIRQNNVKKGDLVYVNNNENDLVISAKEGSIHEDAKTTINVDGKGIPLLIRELNTAYILNNREITIVGKELKAKSKEILEIIRELIALEVLELDSQRIVTKDFLDMDKISIVELARKMDIIVRSMIKDCILTFQENTAANIELRDNDVNRLYFLLCRVIRYGMNNQSTVLKNYKLKAINLMSYFMLTFHLEAIADEAKRISRGMAKVKLSKAKQKKFEDLLTQVSEFYLVVIKAFYAEQREKAMKLTTTKAELIEKINSFYDENSSQAETSYMVDRLRRMVGAIHELNRITFQH